jgi:hypothetical protein
MSRFQVMGYEESNCGIEVQKVLKFVESTFERNGDQGQNQKVSVENENSMSHTTCGPSQKRSGNSERQFL